MNYKPDGTILMAYLYGELQGDEKRQVELYLAEHPETVKELEALTFVRDTLSHVPDKEVIAPPIVLESKQSIFFWNTSFGKAIIGIAASITLILLAGKLTDLQLRYSNQTLTLSFGSPIHSIEEGTFNQQPSLTSLEVQQMINTSLQQNNETILAGWSESETRLSESIRKNLSARSDTQFQELIKKVSVASDDQVRQFAVNLQVENAKMMKDYMSLTSADQRKYIEELLVDFARYLEQQHRNDLQVLQARLNNIEQNTDLFKYETEQILTSIMTSVEGTNTTKGIKN